MLNKLRALAHHAKMRLVLAYIAGACTALSFAPYSIWPIYLIAMATVLHMSRNLSAKIGRASCRERVCLYV